MPLADLQRRLRDVVVAGDTLSAGDERDVVDLIAGLVGGTDARARLAIHQRHYHASLVTSLLARFPATGWLVGSQPLIDVAQVFVRRQPPVAPCIAEYGADFPDWLGRSPTGGRVPYLTEFARFDWHLGRVAVQVDAPSLSTRDLANCPADRLADLRLTPQPGLAYLEAGWPIDTLMTIFLRDDAPDQLALAPEPLCLEVRGARGEFRFRRLEPSEFAFRRALHRGAALHDAAAAALSADASFNPGLALTALLAQGLVTSIQEPTEGNTP